MKYAEIRAKIQERIEILNQKVQLVKEIQDLQRTATQEEIQQLEEDQNPYSTEEICLMLEAKSVRREAKNEDYQPILLDNPEAKEKFISLLSGMKGQIFRFNIILKEDKGVHCTPLLIDSRENEIKIFYIDAVGSRSNYDMKKRIEDALGVKAYQDVSVGSQRDKFSCAIFSLKDLNTMSKLPKDELENSLSNDPRMEGKESNNLDARFIKNSQSVSLITRFNPQAIVSRAKNLQAYLQDYQITAEISDGIKKEKNYASIFKAKQYLEYALDILESIPQDGHQEKKMDAIIANRSGALVWEEESSLLDQKQRDIALRYGLCNRRQIELIAKYDLYDEPMINQNLPCFQNMDTTEKIFHHISDLYKDNQVTPENTKRALEDLQKVKEFNNLDQVCAVLDYELDPDLVRNSKCFVLKEKPLQYVGQAYNSSSEEMRKISAGVAFRNIMNLSDINPITLVIKYNVNSDIASRNNFIKNQHLEKRDEMGAAAEAMQYIDYWYQKAGTKGAEAVLMTFDNMFGKKMIALSKVRKITVKKRVEELVKFAKEIKDQKLSAAWQEVQNSIAKEKTEVALTDENYYISNRSNISVSPKHQAAKKGNIIR